MSSSSSFAFGKPLRFELTVAFSALHDLHYWLEKREKRKEKSKIRQVGKVGACVSREADGGDVLRNKRKSQTRRDVEPEW